MKEHDVANAEFSEFVEATGYVITAEHKFVWENLRKELIVSWNKREIWLDQQIESSWYCQCPDCGLIPEKWTVEKCSSAQVKGAEGNEEKSVQ
jgi:hypothetical protein